MKNLRLPNLAVAALVLLAGGVGLAALLTPAAAQQQPAQPGGMSIAVIDIDRLLRESAIAKSANEQIGAIVETYNRQRQNLQGEVEQLQQRLREVQADSSTARDLRTQLAQKLGAFQALSQTRDQEAGRAQSSGVLRLMNAVKDATRLVAQQRNISLVLRTAPPVPNSYDPGDQQQTMEAKESLQYQFALYASPGLDVTNLVLAQMDQTFKAGGGATTAPAAR